MYVTIHQPPQAKRLELLIQRPDRLNGLGPTIGAQLLDALTQIEAAFQQADPPRLLALKAKPVKTRSGRQIWIAGGDLKELQQLNTPPEGGEYARLYQQICQKLEDFPAPVVSLVDGDVLGGGIELLLATDLRLATQSSALSFRQLAMGLTTGYGGCRRLVETVGLSLATSWLLLGQTIDMEEAHKRGIIHELLPDDQQLNSRLHAIEAQMQAFAPQAVATQKRMLKTAWQDKRDDALARELAWFEKLWMAPAHQQALAGFHQRSQPSTKGTPADNGSS